MASFSFRNLFRKEPPAPPPPSRSRSLFGGTPTLPVGRLVGFTQEGMPGTSSSIFQETSTPLPAGSPFSIVAPSRAESAPPFGEAFGSWKPNDGAFTVGELAALVPPEAVRVGVLAHQEIALPLHVLRASLVAGRPAILLSQLHEACPAAFHPPASSQADPIINLPPEKVRRLVEQSGPGAPAGGGGTRPAAPAKAGELAALPDFAAASPWQVAPELPQTAPGRVGKTTLPPPRKKPEELPGSEPPSAPSRSVASPPEPMPRLGKPPGSFAVAEALPSPPAELSRPPAIPAFAPQFDSPFAVVSVGEVPPGVESPFARQPVAVAPPPETPQVPTPPPEGPAAGPGSVLSLGLASLLRPLSYEELGFAPERVPDRVKVELPAEPLLRQLPSGRVTVALDEVISHLSDRIKPAFQNARPGLQLTVPLREIFDTLPGAQLSAPSAPPVETLFSTPFATKAAEDEAGATPPPMSPRLPAETPVALQPIVRETQPPSPAASLLPFVIVPEPAARKEPSPPPSRVKPETVPLPALPLPPSPTVHSAVNPFASPPGRAFDFGLGELPMPPLDEEPIPMESLHEVTRQATAATTVPPRTPVMEPAAGPVPAAAVPTPTVDPRFPIAPPPVLPPVVPAQVSTPAVTPAQTGMFAPAMPAPAMPAPAMPAPAMPVAVQPAPVQPAPVLPPPSVAASFTFAPAVPPVPQPPPVAPPVAAGVSEAPPVAPPAAPPVFMAPPPLVTPSATGVPQPPPAALPLMAVPEPPPVVVPEAGSPVARVNVGSESIQAPRPEPAPAPAPLPEPAAAEVQPTAVSVAGLAEDSGLVGGAVEAVVVETAAGPPAATTHAETAPPGPALPVERAEMAAVTGPSAEAVEPVVVRTMAPATPVEDLSFGYVDEPTQLALRAIFSTDQTLRPQDVVDRSSQFAGLRSCLILTPHATVHSGGAAAADDVVHFRERAGGLFEKTASLVRELDPDAREQMFTLRTARGVVSFFAVGDVCLAILHAEPNFQPGVREKLILVSRSLAEMLGA